MTACVRRLNRTVAIENPGVGSLGALPGPGSVLLSGAPNGSNASAKAQLRLGLSSRISRPFGRRALRIPGRLVNEAGQPIAGATLDVIQRVTGAGHSELVAHARTAANGSFVASVPGGPSRLIEVAYRASTGEAGYAAEAKVQESVRAGVLLDVSPHLTGPEGMITLSGEVEGPVPRQGVVVDLLVHYRGRWEPFRTPRTNSHGRFHVLYQFEGGVGRFPFRALAFAGQSGFPFSSGESGVVDVTTG